MDPAIITNAVPGELFIIRNVANLIHPFEHSDNGYHGTSAALEFAVCGLGISNIIIFGHSDCGGIQSLFYNQDSIKRSFVSKWMSIAKGTADLINQQYNTSNTTQKIELCAQQSLINSFNNLKTFPWIMERVQGGALLLHAWYFHMYNGKISVFDRSNGFINL